MAWALTSYMQVRRVWGVEGSSGLLAAASAAAAAVAAQTVAV
jgi:hypothetical protein